MAEYFYAKIVRNGTTTIAKNVYIHLMKMESQEAATYQGADPHFTYRMDTKYLPTLPGVYLLQQGDHVIDLQTVDPKTLLPRTFLIISEPQIRALMMSWHWIAVRMRGS